jgi:hypothetical protein
MLIHRQNSYALPSKRCTGRREALSCGTGQQSKNPHCIIKVNSAVNIASELKHCICHFHVLNKLQTEVRTVVIVNYWWCVALMLFLSAGVRPINNPGLPNPEQSQSSLNQSSRRRYNL